MAELLLVARSACFASGFLYMQVRSVGQKNLAIYRELVNYVKK